MSPAIRTWAPWLIILSPFIILAGAYNSLPNEILISKSFFSDELTFAPKSLFTVFRVPLIEVVCGVAIAIMRRQRSVEPNPTFDNDHYLFWTILLYTVGVKSVSQAIEILLPGDLRNVFWYITLGVVLVGVSAAAITGGKAIFRLNSRRGRFSWQDTLILFGLLVAYLGLAFWTN